MASPMEDAPVSSQPSPQEAGSRMPQPPRRPEMMAEAADAESGVRCGLLCFHLPRRSKKKTKTKKPAPPVVHLGAATEGKSAQLLETTTDASAAATQRVTFLASASLSKWWPASPPAAAAAGTGKRASGRASSSSFSHWRRSLSFRRVMPHGALAAASARTSFSFPSSPVSASSCTSTPKLVDVCHVE